MKTSTERISRGENQKMRLLFVSNSPSMLFDPNKEIEFSKVTVEEALNGISTNQVNADSVILDAPIDYEQMLTLRKVTDQNNLPLILYTSTYDQRIKDMALRLGADDYFHGSMSYTFASQTKLIKRLRAFKIQWLGEQKERKLKNMENYFWLFIRRIVDVAFSCVGLILCSPVFIAISLIREIELIHASVFASPQDSDLTIKIFNWYQFLVLILFSPIFLIITLPLKIGAKDVYLFSTEKKVGLSNRIFDQYKFKTEVNRTHYGNEDQSSLLGSFLIKTSLVNLPHLLNILKGDISFFDQSEEELWEQVRHRGLRQAH